MAAVGERKSGLIFCNLVDFDMLYGHRKDVDGFAESLEEFDRMLADFLPLLSLSDMLMITADHGCESRSAVGNYRPFPRICAHPGVFPGVGRGRQSRRPRYARGHGPNHCRKFRRDDSAWKEFLD